PSPTSAGRVVAGLRARGWHLAVAESLTGGSVCDAVVQVPGASQVLRGGVVAYATDVKATVLGVDVAVLAAHGPVHPEVAVQMAQGVRSLLGADVGAATTGVAGPGPAGGVPAGTVLVAVAGPRGTTVHRLDGGAVVGDREAVRARARALCLDAVVAHVDAEG
ncbi:competence protein, partial [Cellulomonas bogoriensis 69B4 = DSM 16987]